MMSESMHPVRALLCTIPLDIGIPRESFGLPVMPKIAIVSLIKWMEKHGYGQEHYDFFDIDMLDSSDDEIRSAIGAAKPSVIGFSATVSTTYSQVKRIATIAREIAPQAWLILGGSLSASARVILHKTAIDICIQGDGENPWVEFLDYTKRFGRDWNYGVRTGRTCDSSGLGCAPNRKRFRTISKRASARLGSPTINAATKRPDVRGCQDCGPRRAALRAAHSASVPPKGTRRTTWPPWINTSRC